jgi:para-nitrobenzyl esterase
VTNRLGLLRTSFSSLAFLAFVFFLQPREAYATDDSLVVRTTAGQIRGEARAGGGAEFLGIPYAQPPVGDLRWREPQPAATWSGIRDTSAFGAPCAQPVLGDWNHHDADNGKEDCLFLNIVTPAWPVKKPLPVMFWIHGGANEGGSGTGDLYNSGTLVNHGVLLVTINYRLGIFGFFAHPALTRESPHHASGNYGLMDQILALRWVLDNIANFGGDPHNITVFGQSAGAMDTGMLMTSIVKDLFQKAIAESGSPVGPTIAPLADAEKSGDSLATDLKALAGDAAIAALRKLSAPDLLAALAALPSTGRPRVGPDIDGWVLTRSPAAVFAAGQESKIPFLFGTTTREFGSSATPDQLRGMIQLVAGDFAPRALAAYGLADGASGTDDPKYGTPADQWTADIIFRCPATAQAVWHTAAHHHTYEYEFDHPIPGQEEAVHSSELPYVFGFFPKSGNIAGNFGTIDSKLADLIGTYFTNFAKTGDPNSAGRPPWPQFGDAQTFIQFMPDGSVVPAARLRAAQCSVFRDFLTDQIKQK